MSKEASLGQRFLAKVDTVVSKAFGSSVSTYGDERGKRIERHSRPGKVIGVVESKGELIDIDSENTVFLSFDADGKLMERKRFGQLRQGERILSSSELEAYRDGLPVLTGGMQN